METKPINTTAAEPMNDAPEPRLSVEEAETQWRSKLGLKPGEKPVSMTDMVRRPNGNGGWIVGG